MLNMDSEYNNYKSWYVNILEKLYPDRAAGISILMIAFPLLERYLRQTTKLNPKDALNSQCMEELRKLFPALSDEKTAWNFWNVYRNGILHQAALSVENRKGSPMPTGWMSHDIGSSVTVEADGSFWVHPVLFSQQVIQVIERNFGVFKGKLTSAPSLPTVVAHVAPAYNGNIPPVYLGTRSGP